MSEEHSEVRLGGGRFASVAAGWSPELALALIGNPNTGKSSIFNALCGMNARVGNYPGVTVEKKLGRCRLGGQSLTVVDLPGTYSLAPRSADELVTLEVLLGLRADVPRIGAVVVIADASNLHRNLYLFSQLRQLGLPLLLVLNMWDRAEAQGLRIDVEQLELRLGVPIVTTSANRRLGLEVLQSRLAALVGLEGAGGQSLAPASGVSPAWSSGCPAADRNGITAGGGVEASDTAADAFPSLFHEVAKQLAGWCEAERPGWWRTPLLATRAAAAAGGPAGDTASGLSADGAGGVAGGESSWRRFLLQRLLLDREGAIERWLLRAGEDKEFAERLAGARQRLVEGGLRLSTLEPQLRYAWIAERLSGCVQRPAEVVAPRLGWLDRWLTHRVWGLVIFVLVMLLVFQSIASWAAWPMERIETAQAVVQGGVEGLIGPGTLRSLLSDGVVAGIGSVLVFLPQILILFLFIAVLEDCGYLARAAFVMDRLMHRLGLSGRSFVPLMSSFACAVPGIMSTRTIENVQDRMVTILVAPLMSCSARLPVYVLMTAAFVPDQAYLGGWLRLQALVLLAMYFVGAGVAVPVAWLLRLTFFRGEPAPFVMELPPMQWPSWRVVFQRVWERAEAFLYRAGTLIFCTAVLVWAAGYFPASHAELDRHSAELERWQGELERAESEGDRQLVSAAAEQLETLEGELAGLRGELLERSFLGMAGRGIEPLVAPLGWDWRIGVGVLASFPAREVIIATLGTIYSLGGDIDESDSGLVAALQQSRWPDGRIVFTLPVALSVMVFFALCAQCAATLMVIRRETNSWRWPIFTFVYMTSLAYLGAWLTYEVGSWLL